MKRISERFSARGDLWFQFILPTASLRDLVYAHLRKHYPELNYCCEWKDTHGYGLSMTVVDWKKDGMYHVPG
jgi:hypothetical protein